MRAAFRITLSLCCGLNAFLFAVNVNALEPYHYVSTESQKNSPLMKPKLQLSFRVGFGPEFEIDYPDGTLPNIDTVGVDADPSPGATLRFEYPVCPVITTGPWLSYFAFRGEGFSNDRDHAMEIGAFLKMRHIFDFHRKERKTNVEAYILMPVGLALQKIDNSGGDEHGVGWFFALMPGVQVFFTDHVGIFGELGYSFNSAKFNITGPGDLVLRVKQATAQLGISFAI